MKHFLRRFWIALLALAMLLTASCQAAGGDSAAPADGIYTPDEFYYAGGTGKARFSCPQIRLENGEAWALLTVDSKNYTYFKVDDVIYETTVEDGSASAEIPVRLNAVTTVTGQTTAMSQPHEITYQIYVYLAAAGEDDTPDELRLPGLTLTGQEENRAAALFSIARYEGGFALLTLKDGPRYLIVPEETEAPALLPPDVLVITEPVKAVYIGEEKLFDRLTEAAGEEAESVLTLAGFESDRAEFLGSFDDLNMAGLLKNGCSLALLPGVFADPDLPEEDAKALQSEWDALSTFGVTPFPDLSDREETELGSLEWLRAYGLLLGREESFDAAFEQLAQEVEKK